GLASQQSRRLQGLRIWNQALGSGGPRTFLSAHFLRFDRHEADKNVRGPSKNSGSTAICEFPADRGSTCRPRGDEGEGKRMIVRSVFIRTFERAGACSRPLPPALRGTSPCR